MIKVKIIIILGQPDGILDLKKGFDKALKNIPAASEDLLRIDCLKVHKNCADHLSNNLRLQEIFELNFFQFYCKINRNQLQMVVETTYGLNPY